LRAPPLGALALTTACALVGTAAQWGYGRVGLDLETALLARVAPQATAPPLLPLLRLTLVMCVVGLPALALVGRPVVRWLGAPAARRREVLAVICYASSAALAKVLPWAGYFVALAGFFVLAMGGLRRVFALTVGRALLALLLLSLASLGVGLLLAPLVR
jgi:hypothetical protein